MSKDYIPYRKRTAEQYARENARQTELRRRYAEELKRKMAGELTCSHCGTELLEFATYCGFCEIELGLAPAR